MTGRVLDLLVSISEPIRLPPRFVVPNRAAGAASQMVTSRASPTPTRVPIGVAPPRLTAKSPSSSSTFTWRARLSVTSITRIPYSEASAGAFSMACRDGPTEVEQPAIAIGTVTRKSNLAVRVRGRAERNSHDRWQVLKILNKTANPTRNTPWIVALAAVAAGNKSHAERPVYFQAAVPCRCLQRSCGRHVGRAPGARESSKSE